MQELVQRQYVSYAKCIAVHTSRDIVHRGCYASNLSLRRKILVLLKKAVNNPRVCKTNMLHSVIQACEAEQGFFFPVGEFQKDCVKTTKVGLKMSQFVYMNTALYWPFID